MNNRDEGEFPLWGIYFHVTSACNMSCSYCYSSPSFNPISDELTKEDYDRIWPDVAALKPSQVIFTGGEPLLRPDMMDIIRGLKEADKDHAISRCLNTNGTLITPDLAKNMLELVDHIRVSLDGPSAINDKYRGQGSFNTALEALDILSNVGFEPRVTITVSKINLPYVKEFVQFMLDRGIKDIKINVLRAMGRGKDYSEFILSPEEMEKVNEETLQLIAPDKQLYKEEWRTTCNVGRFIDVTPNGMVSPCHVLRQYKEFQCGNLRDMPLIEMCSNDRLMGQLANLNFTELVKEDWGLASILDPYSCMGDVYGKFCEKPVWKKIITLMQI